VVTDFAAVDRAVAFAIKIREAAAFFCGIGKCSCSSDIPTKISKFYFQ
jgi:hypothetical protein